MSWGCAGSRGWAGILCLNTNTAAWSRKGEPSKGTAAGALLYGGYYSWGIENELVVTPPFEPMKWDFPQQKELEGAGEGGYSSRLRSYYYYYHHHHYHHHHHVLLFYFLKSLWKGFSVFWYGGPGKESVCFRWREAWKTAFWHSMRRTSLLASTTCQCYRDRNAVDTVSHELLTGEPGWAGGRSHPSKQTHIWACHILWTRDILRTLGWREFDLKQTGSLVTSGDLVKILSACKSLW